jgi:uncharacterized membrane protein YphA (DoxX/SURF4 family)
MRRNQLTLILSALIIVLFVYTATGKFFDFASFRAVLHTSPIVGEKAPVVAWALPLLEFGISLLLLFHRTRRQGLWSALVLLIIYSGYLLYQSLFLGESIYYSAGILQQVTWWQHLIINFLLISLTVLGLRLYRPKPVVEESRVLYSAMC